MDLQDMSGVPFPAMRSKRESPSSSPSAIYGMIPLVIPSLFTRYQSLPIAFPRNRDGSEIRRQLASQVGHVFCVESGPVRNPTRRIGPRIVQRAAAALNLDMDAYTNVDSLSFSFSTLITLLIVIQTTDQSTDSHSIPPNL
jgi:hypothetical protein